MFGIAVSDDDEEEVVKTAVLSEDTCSYPFTSDGKLYYSCVPSIISLCDAWCLNMFAQRRTCSKDDYGKSQLVRLEATRRLSNYDHSRTRREAIRSEWF